MIVVAIKARALLQSTKKMASAFSLRGEGGVVPEKTNSKEDEALARM
jgi:hypothetical protein